MSVKKISFNSKLKSKVILEVLKEEKTITEIASYYKIAPTNIYDWKKRFLENIELTFDKEKALGEYKQQLKNKESKIDDLYRQIGKLNSQLDWAKKKSKEAGFELSEEFN